MEDLIKYIESKTLLNKTTIIRYVLVELYKAEKMKEEKVNGDIMELLKLNILFIN